MPTPPFWRSVIAGEPAAVTWAAARLEEEFCAHTVVIEHRVPMHTPLLTGVAEQFRPALDRAAWIENRSPAHAVRLYWPNVSATPLPRPTRADFIGQLAAHVTSPVLWRASVESVAADNPAATFVEVGPGGVLSNMLSRRYRGAVLRVALDRHGLREVAGSAAHQHAHGSAAAEQPRVIMPPSNPVEPTTRVVA